MTGIDEESKNEVFGHLLAIELMLNMLVTRVCLDRGPYAIELADVFRGDMRKNLDAIKTPEDPTKAASVKQALAGADKAMRLMLADDSRALLQTGNKS